MDSIPLFYFQTKVAMIDDFSPYIDGIAYLTGIDLERFESSIDAKNILTQYQAKIAINTLLENIDASVSEEKKTQKVLNNISSLMKNIARHDDISVLLVDYQMPELNGLELLGLLKNKTFRKLLLTAEASNETIIDAFNERKIDYYFCKNDKKLHKVMSEDIRRQINTYFVNLTNSIINFFPHVREISNSESACQFFHKVTSEKNIEEFFIVDANGVFKLIDQQ